MPEGDTIHRTAASLRHALSGSAVVVFEGPRLVPPFPAPGETVDTVEARGKHLLIGFSGGLVLHSHMKMTGSWHLYRPGARWRRPRSGMRARVLTGRADAVCFDAPVVEILDAGAVARHPALRRLGPDLCLPEVDLDAIVRRSHDLTDEQTTVADLLLDQKVAAGIGNVYKSEIAFLHGLHPDLPVTHLSPDLRRAAFATAHRLLRENLTILRRTTVPDAPEGSLWVYGRGGRPCRRCGTPVESTHTGDAQRVTFHCPRCQPAMGPPGPTGTP